MNDAKMMGWGKKEKNGGAGGRCAGLGGGGEVWKLCFFYVTNKRLKVFQITLL